MVPRDLIVEYPSEYMIPQLRNETKREICANYAVRYYGQNFPSTASHISIQSQGLPPSHTQPLPAGRQAEDPVLSHEPYYPTPLPENVN